MNTIERDNSSAMAILVVGLVIVAAIVALTVYFLRMYPFPPPATQTGTPTNVNVEFSNPVNPSSSGY